MTEQEKGGSARSQSVSNQVSAGQSPNSYGAVDLSAVTEPSSTGSQPAAFAESGSDIGSSQAVLNVPLIVEVNEANFEEQMTLSESVPVILAFYSGSSLTSQQAVSTLEDVTRQYAGAFALGKIDTDIQPDLAAALQIQSLPTAMALVARRPVPLFEGPASQQQLESLMTELLEVAPQLGVTGKIQVSDVELEKPMPASHEAPREAEMNDDWNLAIQLWKKVLANNPSDSEAKLALVRAEFEARQQSESLTEESQDPLTIADAQFRIGNEAEAFAGLLDVISAGEDPEIKEAARIRLVELFKIASNPEDVKKARTRLANMLMV